MGALKWHEDIRTRLVQDVIRWTYLKADLPVSSHRQVTARAERPFAIGKQVDAIGSHIYVQHGTSMLLTSPNYSSTLLNSRILETHAFAWPLWLMPRLQRAVPCLGYILVVGEKPASSRA